MICDFSKRIKQYNKHEKPKKLYLPRNVSFPTSPCFTKMLQNNTGFVLFDSFRHHVQNIMHHCGSKFQVKVTLNSLLGDCFGNTFGVSPFKLSGQQISKPAFQEGYNTTQEKEPHPPSRSPEATPRSFTYRSLEKKKLFDEASIDIHVYFYIENFYVVKCK